ncbi:MAG: helix-turn-helix transcriptional regulator [Pseudomonadota bacterium]|nr:helix-turn-helix transcriptional regulator [Pseudomonadota bacterium]
MDTTTYPRTAERMRATALAAAIDDRGIKRNWLAKKVGVHPGHVTNVAKYFRTVPRPLAEQIADVLGVPLDSIFEAA